MCTVHLKTTTTTPPSNRSLVCFSYSRRRADYTVVCELQCSYDLQPTKIKWNWKTNAWQSYDRLKEIQQQKPSVRIFITCHFFFLRHISFHLLPSFLFATMLIAFFPLYFHVACYFVVVVVLLISDSSDRVFWWTRLYDFAYFKEHHRSRLFISQLRDSIGKMGHIFLRTGNVEPVFWLRLSLAPSNTRVISLALVPSWGVF